MGAEQRSKVPTSWRLESAEATTLVNIKGFHNECTTNVLTMPVANQTSRHPRTGSWLTVVPELPDLE